MITDAFSKTAEGRILASANEALSRLPEDARDAARLARTQLFEWLSGVGQFVDDPKTLISDSYANLLCNVFDGVLAAAVQAGRAEPLLAAWKALTEDTQLALMRVLLQQFVGRAAVSSQLVSLPLNGVTFWEATGFFSDSATKAVNAKVGNSAFQPIGFHDDELYVPTEGSKLLWAREFGAALIFPYAPAFQVTRNDVKDPREIDSEDPLYDSELIGISEVIEWFSHDLELFNRVAGTDGEHEHMEKMRAGLALARVQLPRLDSRLSKIVDQSPELGDKLENADIVSAVRACREYLQMKLDEWEVRRQLQTVELHMQPRMVTLMRMYARAQAVLDNVLHETPFDEAAAARKLREVVAAIPEVRTAIFAVEDERPVRDGVAAALKWLSEQTERMRNEAKAQVEADSSGGVPDTAG